MEKKVLIIAEAGVNHNGSMDNARKLIDAAVVAGVDYIKFQTFKADKLVSKKAEKAEYQKKNAFNDETQFEMLKKLELSHEQHLELIAYANQQKIRFLSTPFDLESIDLLVSLGIKTGKVPSGDITNRPYLKKMAESFEDIIISTGMASLEEIGEALDVLLSSGQTKETITVLHCNTEYPTPMRDVNLKAMLQIGSVFDVKTGYSDHTLGIEVPIAAVALGAEVIEKHFTLDKDMEGPDHKASLEPGELTEMVRTIRNIEVALGSGEKKVTESEAKNKDIARKSIVASRRIEKGEVFSDENLTTKRPGDGINPMRWLEVTGKVAERDFAEDEKIEI
ncbi:N-acetylneuraminate synthase [Emticicia sp. CRIBPO]|uniref:N-acetylneuraminate synthase n=1 Tax=Emticicia sp. CRIBPO TaxID=2683258 RepID=UPI001411B4CB|nr:N-acetylneuraminate synthase [Emticicia sp. CRIBPO]NBA88480.1 N-acetylneuraminate synthase [Emticicia sp. CRIBPO]